MRQTIKRILVIGILFSVGSPPVSAEDFSLDAPRWALLPQDSEDESSSNDTPVLDEDDRDSTLRDALKMLSDDRDDALNSDLEDLDLMSEENDEENDPSDNESLFAGRETQFNSGRFSLPPIAALTTDKSEIGNGETPDGFREGVEPVPTRLPESGVDRNLAWAWNQRYWAAANTFSHPLYFEDRMLERHGHARFPHLQPLVSASRFASQAVLLPYLSTIHPPCECQYALGYYRAGSCAPAMLARPPYKRKAVVAQAVSIATTAVVLP